VRERRDGHSNKQPPSAETIQGVDAYPIQSLKGDDTMEIQAQNLQRDISRWLELSLIPMALTLVGVVAGAMAFVQSAI
jgi:hypothetical protein